MEIKPNQEGDGLLAKYKFDVDTKVAIFEEFLKQMVTTPRNFLPLHLAFCFLFLEKRGREPIFGQFPVRLVTLNSGQRTELHHQTMTPQVSDVTPRYFDRNLQCLSVDFVLLLNTKIHHVYTG